MRFYGYINALAAGFILVVLVGSYYSIGVFAPAMGKAFGWSAAQFGAVLSITILGWGLTAPLVGVLVTRRGPRVVMATGCFLAAATMTGMFFVNELWQFYVLSLPLAFGLDLGAALPAMQLMSIWFLKRRATMIGLVMAGGGIGGMVVVPLTRIMINGFGTWRTAWLPLAVAAGVSGILALLLIRNQPEEMGQHVDGASGEEVVLFEAPGAQAVDAMPLPARVYVTTENWSTGAALKTPAFWLIVAAVGALNWTVNTVVVHQVPFLEGEMGVSAEFAAATLGIVVGLSTLGRMVSGWLGDRVEPRKVMGAFLVASALGVLLLMTARGLLLVYAYVLLFGIAYGGVFVPQPALLANYFGAKNFAVIMSLQMPFMTLMGAASPVASGLIKDVTGSYATAWLIAVAACFLGAVCAFLARPPQSKAAARVASG